MRSDPLGVYIHLPFCRTKCFYCDFNSRADAGQLIPAYLHALAREMEAAVPVAAGREVASVYVGGGTPTVVPARQLGELLGLLRRRLKLAAGAEITVESNPGTLGGPDLELLREAGYNRLSVGVQSFQPDFLRRLGRSHAASQARQAVVAAREAGFDNISLDLMFGLPGQGLRDWRRDLEEALALRPPHLSAYGLTLAEGTPFYRWHQRGELRLPDEDEQAAMFDLTRQVLGAAGYEAYEISNFARPGYRCRHNELYWRNEEYLGFGAGATSYLGGSRETNEPDPAAYIAAVERGRFPRVEFDRPGLEVTMAETVILGLRTAEGVTEQRFRDRFGRSLRDVVGPRLRGLEEEGLVLWEGGNLRLTLRGTRLGNVVFRALL